MSSRQSSPKNVTPHGPIVAALRAEFPVEKVQQRPGGGGKQLDYIPIETTLERLLEFAPQYNLTIKDHDLYHANGGWFGHAVVHLEIDGKTAAGVGAMINSDPDMATKSALSEAIKNAAKNGWGLALYLWDKEKLAEIAAERQELKKQENVVPVLRELVIQMANSMGWVPPATNKKNSLAEFLGVAPAVLDSPTGLQQILDNNPT